MDRYLRNLQTLRRCQLARDYQEAPEYWSDEDWESIYLFEHINGHPREPYEPVR